MDGGPIANRLGPQQIKQYGSLLVASPYKFPTKYVFLHPMPGCICNTEKYTSATSAWPQNRFVNIALSPLCSAIMKIWVSGSFATVLDIRI